MQLAPIARITVRHSLTGYLARARRLSLAPLLKTTGSDEISQATEFVANDGIASGVTPQIQLG